MECPRLCVCGKEEGSQAGTGAESTRPLLHSGQAALDILWESQMHCGDKWVPSVDLLLPFKAQEQDFLQELDLPAGYLHSCRAESTGSFSGLVSFHCHLFHATSVPLPDL